VRVSEQLAEAIKPERVRLGVGQPVEVRTREGDLVIQGTIQSLDPVTKTVQVVDRGSGADLLVDVDPSRYNIWVQGMQVPGTAPKPGKQAAIDNVRGSTPGVFTLGKRFRIMP
jgi:hypothetical protein